MRKHLVVKKNKTKLFVIIIFILIISTNSALGNSLITTIYIPEGIVMASDSRQSLSLNEEITSIITDTATKLFLLEKHKIGVSTCGDSFINNISISSHIKNFIEKELTDDDDVITVANKLFEYFKIFLFTTKTYLSMLQGIKKKIKQVFHMYIF